MSAIGHLPAPAAPAVPALSAASLEHLPDHVRAPTYDRSALRPAVVHIGVGCFHRAHQALYFDDLAQQGISTDWGIVGVGLHRPEIGRVLAAQDDLYSVVVRGAAGDEVRVVGAIVRYLFAPEDPEAVLAVLADERTRLVTLTITATAYPDGDVDPADAQVRADVLHPEAPATAFGYLVEALARRRRAGLPPFTVLSCDNLQDNGAATRRAVVSTARLREPALAAWIEEHGAFPASMVDRITPESAPAPCEGAAHGHGTGDRWPVVTEPFSQWAVEDRFCAGRPPLERVGVQFLPDVSAHVLMKTRLLNGAHSALGHLARLAGFTTTDAAMADPVVRGFVEGYLREAAAVLPQVPGVDLTDYRASLLQRLANPRMGDQVDRLCRRGSSKVPAFVLPSVQLALERELPRDHLVLALAAWLRYLRGSDCAGRPVRMQDERAERLRALALAGGSDPRPLLRQRDVFGTAGADPRLTREVARALRALEAGALPAAAALRSPAGRD